MDDLTIPAAHLRKLLGAASPDAALLYLHLRSGTGGTLPLPPARLDAARALLGQLELLPNEPPDRPPAPPAIPYTEHDVVARLAQPDFSAVVGEAQRRMGRLITDRELQSLLYIYDQLRLPPEVIGMLISYCIQRSRSRGSNRMPSMRTIEKEAGYWAEHDITTLETAAAFLQAELEKLRQVTALRAELELTDRPLTPAEERYLTNWVAMGFGPAEVALAHERTCLNTGAMRWPYCNSILRSWHEQGLLTVEAIRAGDHAPRGRGQAANGAEGAYEQAALEQLLRQEEEDA